jgi:GH15 family glucan-1,4-alpha-glucosidase
VRDQIYKNIMERGWSPERKAFVQTYGGDTLDASNLIMSLVFFLSPKDPRMLSTLEAIDRSPRDGRLVSNSLVYRYDVEQSADGLTGEEGTFSLCTFWLVEALTRAGRPGSSSSRCSATPTTWDFMRRRLGPAVRHWATSPRPSRTLP